MFFSSELHRSVNANGVVLITVTTEIYIVENAMYTHAPVRKPKLALRI